MTMSSVFETDKSAPRVEVALTYGKDGFTGFCLKNEDRNLTEKEIALKK